jgi:integrase
LSRLWLAALRGGFGARWYNSNIPSPLTAARRDEVRLAQWAEIDPAGRIWTVPGERMKIGREHRVPLSEAATTLLQALPRRGPYLFPGRGSALAENTMLHLLRVQLGRAGKATVHGFRSCFVDWATEQTNFPSEVREMALAHAVGDKVEAAYRRGDLFEKRWQLAEAWARYCGGSELSENVVRLAGRAG